MSWPATAIVAMALVRVDLPLDRMDVGDRGEVEIFAPDEGRELVEEVLARVDVAGDGPRLDEGGALPVLADALVIGEGRLERDRDRRRAGVGPQPQIGAEDIAVRACAPHDLHDALGERARRARRLPRIGEAGAARSKKTMRSMSEE